MITEISGLPSGERDVELHLGRCNLPFLHHLVNLVKVDDTSEDPRQLAFRALSFYWSPC